VNTKNETENFIYIIPKPVELTISPGEFILNNETRILVDNNSRINGNYLRKILAPATGFNIPISDMSEITRIMVERGYSEARITKILGGNFMRIFREVASLP